MVRDNRLAVTINCPQSEPVVRIIDTKTSKTLLSQHLAGLETANGVTLSHDEQLVIFGRTSRGAALAFLREDLSVRLVKAISDARLSEITEIVRSPDGYLAVGNGFDETGKAIVWIGKGNPEWTLSAASIFPGRFGKVIISNKGQVQQYILLTQQAALKRWELWISINGRNREYGLGVFPRVNLSAAREKADRAHAE